MNFDTQYIIIRVIVWEPIFAVTIVPFRASTVKDLGSNGGDSFFFFGWRIRTVLPILSGRWSLNVVVCQHIPSSSLSFRSLVGVMNYELLLWKVGSVIRNKTRHILGHAKKRFNFADISWWLHVNGFDLSWVGLDSIGAECVVKEYHVALAKGVFLAN